MDDKCFRRHLRLHFFVFQWSLVCLCLAPRLIICYQVQNESVVPQEDSWTRWLDYIGKTSDPMTSQSAVVANSSLTDDPCVRQADDMKWMSTNTTWRRIFVAQDGTGHYRTIKQAVKSVPNYSTVRTVICIGPGVYREKVVVDRKKHLITLQGDSNGTTVIWNDTAATIGSKGRPLRTFGSATMAISGKHFIARNMIFKNDAPPPVPGQVGGQAVALRVSGDKAAFYNCKFFGYQDTLYDHKGRHYFQNCYIDGSVDFIFGNGRSLYNNCELYASSLGAADVGSVTAQKRNESALNTGFSFVNCNLTGEGHVYLGRAWGQDSRVVFSYTWMGNIVVPEGWNNWGISARDRTVYYAEYKCEGPGASSGTRVPWSRVLTPEEVGPFLGIWYINGGTWI